LHFKSSETNCVKARTCIGAVEDLFVEKVNAGLSVNIVMIYSLIAPYKAITSQPRMLDVVGWQK
jgi:hypothetical protein